MLSRSPLLSSVVIALIAGGTTIVACSSSSSSGGDTNTDSGTPTDGGGSDVTTSTKLAVTPATANVLTCDALQFKETGGAGGGVWSVSPSGSINAKSGIFTAPNTIPAVTSVDDHVHGSARQCDGDRADRNGISRQRCNPCPTLPTKPASVTAYPFEHAFTASGTRVYTAVMSAPVSGACRQC